MRTNVYFDGFNFYFGAVRGTPYKWLDLMKFSKGLLRPENEISRIRYFTARVSARPNDQSAPERQSTYFRALETLPNLTIHLGQFFTNEVTLPRAGGGGFATVLRTEEKGSDVNLGAYLLVDAAAGEYETALVVSNDSDLIVPIELARERFGVVVGIACPVVAENRRPNQQLVTAADFNVHITEKRRKLLRESQFPNPVYDADGRKITKPKGW
jgi:uncharacterized LabA/DUF88 family protein